MNIPSNNSKAKQVYIGMAGDLIHPGHIELINDAKQYGEITIGLVSDKGMTEYKRLPAMPYEQRKIVLENIKGVKRVIKQDSPDYVKILTKLKPDFVVKGDDWIKGQPKIRQRVIDTMSQWGGVVIDSKRKQNFSSTSFHQHLRKAGTTKEVRQAKLQRLLESTETIRAIEAHNGLSAKIIEESGIRVGWKVEEFDAIWLSAKTFAISCGHLNISQHPINDLINQVLHTSTKPIIVDLGYVNSPKEFCFKVKSFEQLGVSAVVIKDSFQSESKIKTKLYPIIRNHIKLESIEKITSNISDAKKSLVSEQLMVFVKVESLIITSNINHALNRSDAYITAGVDGIVISANPLDTNLLIEFCQKFKKLYSNVFLIVSVSDHPHLTEYELSKNSVDLIVYENNLLRASYPSMQKIAESILINKRTKNNAGVSQ